MLSSGPFSAYKNLHVMLSSSPLIEGAHQLSIKNYESQKRDDAFPIWLEALPYQMIPDRHLKGERYQMHTACIDQRVILGLRANISGFRDNLL
jgi:hypothetical protein